MGDRGNEKKERDLESADYVLGSNGLLRVLFADLIGLG
jgi:hypothetical protein